MRETGSEQYAKREKRVKDAIQLKIPDRVPVWFQDASFFPAKYTGMTFEEAMYNDDKLFAAYKKTFLDFQPDMYFNPGHAFHTPGDALEAVDCKQIKWPGHGVPPNHTFQFVEGEYMKAEEYDDLLADPSDFTTRVYLPRVMGTLTPFNQLPPAKAFLLGYFGMPLISAYVTDDVVQSFKSFYKAGLAISRHNKAVASFHAEVKDAGFPLACGAITLTPFDVFSDTLRGMRGAMLDMYRQPDKLLEGMERVLPMLIDLAVTGTKISDNKGVFIPLHRGAHGFMSLKQFEEFYWSGLKRLILALIDKELTPCPFFEGDYTSRLEYLGELPKGKVLGLFDGTDIYRAKDVLRNTMCISGMMPVSLLQTGTPDSVKEYAKKLIDVVGKDGGFIMGPRGAMDECDPRLVKVWMDFTREYGVYR